MCSSCSEGRGKGKGRTELTLYTSSIITEREPGCLLSTGDGYDGFVFGCAEFVYGPFASTLNEFRHLVVENTMRTPSKKPRNPRWSLKSTEHNRNTSIFTYVRDRFYT